MSPTDNNESREHSSSGKTDASDDNNSTRAIDGDEDRPDTELELAIDRTAAKIDTELLKADTFFDGTAAGSGVRVLTDGFEDPILLLGTITPSGEEMTTAAVLSLDEAEALGQTLVEHAEWAEQARAEKRREREQGAEDARGLLSSALKTFRGGGGDGE